MIPHSCIYTLIFYGIALLVIPVVYADTTDVDKVIDDIIFAVILAASTSLECVSQLMSSRHELNRIRLRTFVTRLRSVILNMLSRGATVIS